MIEPASVIFSLPVGLSIAPPSVDFFGRGSFFAQHIAPSARFLRACEAFHFGGRVRDDLQHFFVVPHIVGQRRNVEVAEQDARLFAIGIGEVLAHFFDEGEFVRELRTFVDIGLVAACGYVEVVEIERRVGQLDSSGEVACVFFVAKGDVRGGGDRILGEDSHAVIGFFSANALVWKAHCADFVVWKQRVFDFCFLQAENIGLECFYHAREKGQAHAHRVDVPSGDAECGGHGGEDSMA